MEIQTLDEADINNKSVFETIKDFNICCSICLGILLNPKQCEICETSFCSHCIESWTRKHNSCPMRCVNYKVIDPPRMLKNMLSKLEFKCKKCKLTFFYETYISHVSDCKISNAVNCPLCKNCYINKDVLEMYSSNCSENYLKEILHLQNEVKSYKEIVTVLNEELRKAQSQPQQQQANIPPKYPSNSNCDLETIIGNNSFISQGNNSVKRLGGKVPIDIKWSKSQKKNDFVLSEGDKKIVINYSSCWNFHFADYMFCSDAEETFSIKVLNKGDGFSHHYIGFLNDAYKNDCLCLYNPNAWFIHNQGEELKEGNKVKISNQKMMMTENTAKVYQFAINGHTGKLVIYDDKGNSYGTTYMSGTNFRFFVSKCNSGIFEYTFV